MNSKIKVIQHFLCNLFECEGSTFYLERRPKGRWLCYKEDEKIIAQTRISRKSYQTMMRFTSGVECQRWIDIDTSIDEMEYDQDDDPAYYWFKNHRSSSTNLPAVVTPVKKKEPAPFIVQIFAPAS